MKTCIICKEEKELTEFSKNFYGDFDNICKACVSSIKGKQNLKKKIKKLMKK